MAISLKFGKIGNLSYLTGVGARTFASSSTRNVKLVPKFITKRSLPTVSVLNLTGMIAVDQSRSQFGSRRLNLESLEKHIDKAFTGRNLSAVLLTINSPGGSPVQSELIVNKIIRLSKQKNVKVVSFIEDLAASGGYWLACAADEIFCSKSSMVGSIGVISGRFGLDQFIERYDVDWRIHTSGKSKAFLDPFQPEKEDDVRKLKILLESIHENFINYVKEQRKPKLKATDDILFNGDVWVGQQAVENGLVDGLDNVSNYISEKYGEEKKDVNVVRVNGPRKGFAQLFGGGAGLDIQDLISSQRLKILAQ